MMCSLMILNFITSNRNKIKIEYYKESTKN